MSTPYFSTSKILGITLLIISISLILLLAAHYFPALLESNGWAPMVTVSWNS